MKSQGSHLRLIRGGKRSNDAAREGDFHNADAENRGKSALGDAGSIGPGRTSDSRNSAGPAGSMSAVGTEGRIGPTGSADPTATNEPNGLSESADSAEPTGLSDLLSDKDERGLARYLAIRERAPVEVRQYLSKKGILKSWHDSILERLQQMDLLNEERFCRIRIEHRLRSGQGPRRIQQELGSLGVDRHTAGDCLDEIAGHLWEESCLQVAEEKLRSIMDRESSLQKLLQFLHYRGFESAQIDWALGSLKETYPDWARSQRG